MAAKALDKNIVEKIVADWRTGDYTQRELAAKHRVSAGKVAGLTKDVEKDCEQIVSAGVEYYQALRGKNERIVSAIAHVVDRKARLKGRVQDFVDAAVERGFELIGSTDNGQDFKAIIDGIDKASITAGINERHAKPNTNNFGVAVGDTLRQPAKIIINGRKSD
jgi:hypothetical protein